MSHFAKIENGIVIDVIVAEQDFIDAIEGRWVQTSYNTFNNVHYNPNTGEPDGGIALRGNYASIGHTYDEVNDVFYEPQPYKSWTLNKSSWAWEPPTIRPNDGKPYIWNEELLNWDEMK